MHLHKALSIVFACLLLFYNCSKKESDKASGTYQLQVSSETPVSGTMYLKQIVGNNLVTKDTLVVTAQTTFQMKGTLEAPGLFAFMLGDGTPYLMVIDNIPITIDLKENNVIGSKGSEAHNDFVAIRKVQFRYETQMDSLNQRYILESNLNHVAALAQLDTAFAELKKGTQSNLKKWIFSHKPGFASVYAGSFFNPESDMPFLDSLVTYLDSEVQKPEYIQTFVDGIKKLKSTKPGSFAPDFTQNTHDGRKLSLSSLKGRVVLIDFWASWCGPCRRSNPDLVKLYLSYKDKPFSILSVSLDEDVEKWKKAIKDDGLLWDTHVSDLHGWDNAAAKLYNIEEIPQTYLVDASGKIVERNLHGDALRSKIDELLAKISAN